MNYNYFQQTKYTTITQTSLNVDQPFRYAADFPNKSNGTCSWSNVSGLTSNTKERKLIDFVEICFFTVNAKYLES